jgi:hypothetical protein
MYQDEEQDQDQEINVVDEEYGEEFFAELELDDATDEDLVTEFSIDEDEQIQNIKIIIRSAALDRCMKKDVEDFYGLFMSQDETTINRLLMILAEEEFKFCFNQISCKNSDDFIDFLYNTTTGSLSEKVYLYLKECFSVDAMDKNSLTNVILAPKDPETNNSFYNAGDFLYAIKDIVNQSEDSTVANIAYMREVIKCVNDIQFDRMLAKGTYFPDNTPHIYMRYFKADCDHMISKLFAYPEFLSNLKENFPYEFYKFLLEIKTHPIAEEYISNYFAMPFDKLFWITKANFFAFKECYTESEKIDWIKDFNFYLTSYPEIKNKMCEIFNWLRDTPDLLIKLFRTVSDIDMNLALRLFLKGYDSSFLYGSSFLNTLTFTKIGEKYSEDLVIEIIDYCFKRFFNFMDNNELITHFKYITSHNDLSSKINDAIIKNLIAYTEFAKSIQNPGKQAYFCDVISRLGLEYMLVRHPDGREYISRLAKEFNHYRLRDFISQCHYKLLVQDNRVAQRRNEAPPTVQFSIFQQNQQALPKQEAPQSPVLRKP